MGGSKKAKTPLRNIKMAPKQAKFLLLNCNAWIFRPEALVSLFQSVLKFVKTWNTENQLEFLLCFFHF